MSCPVCFGGGEGPILDGSNMAITTLLAVTLGVLGACAALIVRLARRAARAAAAQPGKTEC
jgi:hypothetical protein